MRYPSRERPGRVFRTCLLLALGLPVACTAPAREDFGDLFSRGTVREERASRPSPTRDASGSPVPLDLDRAIREALEASPEMEQIRSRIRAAAELTRQGEAAFYPRLIAAGEFNLTDNPVYAMMNIIHQRRLRPDTDFNDPGWQKNAAGRVRAEWSLFEGGRRFTDRRAALGMERAEASGLKAARNRLVGRVTEVFFRWLQALEFIGVADLACKETKVNVETGEARKRAGTALESEVLRLRSRAAEARGNRVAARASARRFQAALERLLARRLEAGEIPSVKDHAGPPGFKEEDPEALVESALARRPEIAAVEHLIRAARNRIRSEKGGHFPVVGLFGQYELNTGNLHEYENSWMFGLQASFPVFMGGLTQARVREAEARLREIEARGVQVALDVALEVTHAALAVQESRERIRAAEERMNWARGALRETRKVFEREACTVDSLLQAELEWNRAEVSHTSARFEGKIAVALLGQALGEFTDWVEETP